MLFRSACRLDRHLYCVEDGVRDDSSSRAEAASLLLARLGKLELKVRRVPTLFSPDAQDLIFALGAGSDTTTRDLAFLLIGPVHKDSAGLYSVQFSRVLVDKERDCSGCATMSVDEYTWAENGKRARYTIRSLAARSPIELQPNAVSSAAANGTRTPRSH